MYFATANQKCFAQCRTYRLAASLGPATVNALILLFDVFYCVKVVASVFGDSEKWN